MHKVIIITGYKESGKTQIVESLVKELKNRGHNIGTIKHIPREGFTLDQPETDTWRHAQAGAEKIIAISPDEVATIEKKTTKLKEILLGLKNLDFIVIEGFSEAKNIAKIKVARNREEATELDDEFTIGFIENGTNEKPVWNKDEITNIADEVENKTIPPVGDLDCGECGYATCREFALANIKGETSEEMCTALKGPVSLRIDGRRVPLKSFVRNLIASTISGMVSALRGTEGKNIEIEVERSEG